MLLNCFSFLLKVCYSALFWGERWRERERQRKENKKEKGRKEETR